MAGHISTADMEQIIDENRKLIEEAFTPVYSKGERWYVKLPGATTIITVTIQGITENTVLLMEEKPSCLPTWELRYRIKDIDFVERVED